MAGKITHTKKELDELRQRLEAGAGPSCRSN
jgi:hypothetical protein